MPKRERNKFVKRGQILELKIEDYAFGGKGIARIRSEEGEFVVFIPNTIPGQTVTLTATLSSAVSGETIYFRDNTDSILIGSSTTNSSGQATLSYDPSFSGVHTLQALYQGNPVKNLSPSYKTATLTLTGNCVSNNGSTICVSISTSLTLP